MLRCGSVRGCDVVNPAVRFGDRKNITAKNPAKKSLHTGVRTGCHYLIGLVCLPVCVSVSVVVFTDARTTRPISTNPGSLKGGEYGLMRGACFLACALELDAFDGLLWILWCVLGGADIFSLFFFRFVFSCKPHGLLQV